MSLSSVALHNLNTNQYEDYKGLLDVTADFATTRADQLGKAIYVGIDCAEAAGLIEDKTEGAIGELHHHAKLFKLAHAPGKFVANVNKTMRTAGKLLEGDSKTTLVTLGLDVNSLVAPIYDTLEFLTKAVIHIPKESIKTFSGVNGVALIIAMGSFAIESIKNIGKHNIGEATDKVQRRHSFYETSHSLLKLIKEVAYVALGALTALSVFFGMVIASATTLTILSAITVVFTYLEYYHENLGAPLKKTNKEVNNDPLCKPCHMKA